MVLDLNRAVLGFRIMYAGEGMGLTDMRRNRGFSGWHTRGFGEMMGFYGECSSRYHQYSNYRSIDCVVRIATSYRQNTMGSQPLTETGQNSE